MIRATLAACSAALLLPITASAGSDPAQLAELPLDALLDTPVTGASRFDQRVGGTPQSVTVWSAADLRVFGWRTLGEALAAVRGVMTARDHTYAYLGVRGFFAPGDYNTRVLLLIDGERANDALYDAALLGQEFPLDLALVERIEFIPGPGSSVHGGNALFGVVNVITRQPGSGRSGATVTAGSQRTREGSVRLDQRLGERTALLLSASAQRTSGGALFVPSQSAAGVSDGWGNGDHTERQALYARLSHEGWRGTFYAMDRSAGTPAVSGPGFGDPRARYRDAIGQGDLRWDGALDEHMQLTLRGFAATSRFTGTYADGTPNGTLNMDQAYGRWGGASLRLLGRWWAGHTVATGLEYQRATDLRQVNYDEGARSQPYLDDNRRATDWSFYAEDRIELGPSLTTTAGGRFDRRVGQSGRLSPRLGLHWHPTPNLALRAVHGTAFRLPNTYETNYAVNGTQGNAALRRETVRSNEVAADWRWHPQGRLSASVYRQQVERLITQVFDPAINGFQFRNVGFLKSEGLEVEAEWFYGSGARLRASVAQQRGSDSQELPVAALSPRRMGKLLLSWPLVGVWTAGVDAQAYGRRGEAPGYGTVNLTLSQPLNASGLNWRVMVHDLLDRRPSDPGTGYVLPVVPQRGRQAWLQIDWQH